MNHPKRVWRFKRLSLYRSKALDEATLASNSSLHTIFHLTKFAGDALPHSVAHQPDQVVGDDRIMTRLGVWRISIVVQLTCVPTDRIGSYLSGHRRYHIPGLIQGHCCTMGSCTWSVVNAKCVVLYGRAWHVQIPAMILVPGLLDRIATGLYASSQRREEVAGELVRALQLRH